MRLLIVDPDQEFREELHNFLLSAGYGPIAVAEACDDRLDRLGRHGVHTVILGAASPSASRPAVKSLRGRWPQARLIVLIDADDPADGKRWTQRIESIVYLYRSTYSRQLPYLLEGGDAQ